MILKIQKLNEDIIKQAQNFFGACFCDSLKIEKAGTFNESLVSRYIIEKNKNKFSSISHKKNLVFIGTNNTKIGVDIEILKKRDESLLKDFLEKEYRILGGKSWENFYVLWTAKESIIKFENLILDDIKKIEIIKNEKISKNISGIGFNRRLIFEFKSKIFEVFNGEIGNLVYSVCINYIRL